MVLVLMSVSCSAPKATAVEAVNTSGYDFVILHYNDFHARNTPWVPTRSNAEGLEVGGAAYLDAMMDSVEALYPHALRFHAGDDFQGTPVSSITRGGSQLEILQKMGLDFFTIGNHEFDYGWSVWESALDTLRFPVGAANLILTESGEKPLVEYMVFEKFGKKLGLIPLTTPELKNLVLDSNIEGLHVEDPARTARELIVKLKAEGVEFFVALTHQGLDEDMKLAEDVPELDLVIGGHSHSYVPTAKMQGKTRVVQTGSYGRNLGIIKLSLNEGDISDFNYSLEEVQPGKLKASADIQAIVDKYEAMTGRELNEVIGVLKKDWIRGGLVSNIGAWQCDVMLEALDADLAFQNNGGIRKDLKAGEIRVRDIWEISPFGNTLVSFEIRGDQLEEMIAYMVREFRFRSLQSGGLMLRVDKESQQIRELQVGGEAVDAEKTYRVVTNNYVAESLEKNFGLKDTAVRDSYLVDRDVLIEAVRAQKFIDGTVGDRVIFE